MTDTLWPFLARRSDLRPWGFPCGRFLLSLCCRAVFFTRGELSGLAVLSGTVFSRGSAGVEVSGTFSVGSLGLFSGSWSGCCLSVGTCAGIFADVSLASRRIRALMRALRERSMALSTSWRRNSNAVLSSEGNDARAEPASPSRYRLSACFMESRSAGASRALSIREMKPAIALREMGEVDAFFITLCF